MVGAAVSVNLAASAGAGRVEKVDDAVDIASSAVNGPRAGYFFGTCEKQHQNAGAFDVFSVIQTVGATINLSNNGNKSCCQLSDPLMCPM